MFYIKFQKIGRGEDTSKNKSKHILNEVYMVFPLYYNFLADSKKRHWPMDDKIPITWLITHPPPLSSLPQTLILNEMSPAKTGHQFMNVSQHGPGSLCLCAMFFLLQEGNILCSLSTQSFSAAPYTNILTPCFSEVMLTFGSNSNIRNKTSHSCAIQG